MGKLIQNFLDSLKLTDEDDFDDDDMDDDFEDEPVVRRPRETSRSRTTTAATKESVSSQAPKRFETATAKPIRSVPKTQPIYEEETYEPPRKVTRQPERSSTPMRSASSHGLEVIIKRPTSFDDAQEICDLLKSEHAIIVNLERLDHEMAQKMMDFIAGAIYALDAKIHQISGYIFCISPEKVDISGDYFNMLSENTGFKIPELLKN